MTDNAAAGRPFFIEKLLEEELVHTQLNDSKPFRNQSWVKQIL